MIRYMFPITLWSVVVITLMIFEPGRARTDGFGAVATCVATIHLPFGSPASSRGARQGSAGTRHAPDRQ
ncbi:hypothetical protein TM51_04783 [Thermobifida fusca TM51]|uniref:Uncharacterized protein n=1 Tax=Thermobifida fusca TM51 TaxID=1169414 RepID=A0A9P2WQY4_THEFU|nr:hypothetical protein TM51_04783 [Thermobifida fusca TM51]